MSTPDAIFLHVLNTKRKISKKLADYSNNVHEGETCVKCKFNLGDEGNCHIVEGKIDNERGISKFFSPKGHGMLPGDIVWCHVKKTGKKLEYEEGYIIDEGAQGFQCKDCKFYLYSGGCLLIKGVFTPKMSCGYIVRLGQGTEV